MFPVSLSRVLLGRYDFFLVLGLSEACFYLFVQDVGRFVLSVMQELGYYVGLIFDQCLPNGFQNNFG